jgi:hypothetical protein
VVSAEADVAGDGGVSEMNREEVLKLSRDELRIKAAELTGEWYTCSMEDGVPSGLRYLMPGEKDAGYEELPDYSNDIVVAWELWQIALASDYFWDFCNAIKSLAGNEVDFTVIVGHISPLLITQAFVLIKEKIGSEDVSNGDQ